MNAHSRASGVSSDFWALSSSSGGSLIVEISVVNAIYVYGTIFGALVDELSCAMSRLYRSTWHSDRNAWSSIKNSQHAKAAITLS